MKSRDVQACIPRPSNYIKTKDQPKVGKSDLHYNRSHRQHKSPNQQRVVETMELYSWYPGASRSWSKTTEKPSKDFTGLWIRFL